MPARYTRDYSPQSRDAVAAAACRPLRPTPTDPHMLIQEFCEETGLSRDTVRFYVKRGLLTPRIGASSGNLATSSPSPTVRGRAFRASNRYQVFDRGQVERARLIRAAQGLGFTLAEIGELASTYEAGGMTRTRKAAVLRAHLVALDERASRLRAVRRYLGAKLAWVEAGERGAPPATPAVLRRPFADPDLSARRKRSSV